MLCPCRGTENLVEDCVREDDLECVTFFEFINTSSLLSSHKNFALEWVSIFIFTPCQLYSRIDFN